MTKKEELELKLEKVRKNHQQHLNEDIPFNALTHAAIYIIINNITHMAYVGQTSIAVSQRFHNHVKDAGCKYEPQSKLHPAMREYGEKNFSFMVLEIVPINLVDKKEKEYIVFFDSKINGYNVTAGGEGKGTGADKAEIGALFKEGKKVNDIAKVTGRDRGTVRNVLKALGYKPRSNRTKEQSYPVIRCDLVTGEEIEKFDSQIAAGRWAIKEGLTKSKDATNVGYMIARAASGERKQACRNAWKFSNEKPTEKTFGRK